MNRFSKTLNEKNGLWANIHAKRKRGEKPNPPGHPDRPTAQDFKDAQSTSKKEGYESKGKSVKELRKKKVEVTTDSKIKSDNSNNTETTVSEGPKSPGVGWMLKADPKLGSAVKAKKDINKKREASYGKPSAGVSVPRTPKNDYDRKVDSYLKKKYNEELDEATNAEIHKVLGPTKNAAQGIAALKKAFKVNDAQAKAMMDRVMKESAELDELKKSTLGSYVKKASGDMGMHAVDHGKYGDQQKDSLNKAKKRLSGIGKATDRLTKESIEQVDELSQNTLRQYHGKAALDFRKKRDQLSKGTLSTADHKKGQNRLQGLNRAANKMESVEESDAAYAAGQAKDREQQAKAKLNPNDAKKLDKLRALMAREKK